MSKKTILLDIDGTLVSAGAELVSEPVAAAVAQLIRDNDVYLLSNKRLPVRNALLAQRLGVPLISTVYKKPDPRVLRGLAFRYPDTTVIGDKVLTDGLLAASLGAQFIRVPRITSDEQSVLDRLYNAIDDFARAAFFCLMLLRPRQWIKNALVFIPVFFAGGVFMSQALGTTAAAFVVFCFVASAGYVINDITDTASDRLHPSKRYRPIAAGEVSAWLAGGLAAGLLGMAWVVCMLYVPSLVWLAGAYFISSLVYSLWLKRVAILEMLLFIWFYLARILAGGIAAQIVLTAWLLLTVVFLSLFFVMSKRYAQSRNGTGRAVLAQYPDEFLHGMLFLSAGLIIVFYALYAVLGGHSTFVVYSTMPVLAGVVRYLQLTVLQGGIEYPERVVFKDAGLLAAGIAWFVLIALTFY